MTINFETCSYFANKTCSCGKFHEYVPNDAREWFEDGLLIGFVWECECKSTLFTPTYNLRKQMGAI